MAENSLNSFVDSVNEQGGFPAHRGPVREALSPFDAKHPSTARRAGLYSRVAEKKERTCSQFLGALPSLRRPKRPRLGGRASARLRKFVARGILSEELLLRHAFDQISNLHRFGTLVLRD
jgi:hypothetical protein